MPKFRKRPVEVEARQITAENLEELADWCDAPGWSPFHKFITVPTLEGPLTARVGDYIVKGGRHGECWPVKGDIFEDTYEAVEDDTEQLVGQPFRSAVAPEDLVE
jgi:hypothetical protein